MDIRHIKKGYSRKQTGERVWSDQTWSVYAGELTRGRGHPHLLRQLFSVVAEKIPFGAIDSVARDLATLDVSPYGVYVAHDSMGYARYIGRGDVFSRLKAKKKAQELELQYFSFYIVADKTHEREIETLLIRAGGPQLHFNSRKKRVDIKPATFSISSPEPGFMNVNTRGDDSAEHGAGVHGKAPDQSLQLTAGRRDDQP